MAVEFAKLLGKKVSIGGFSTGGALSLNKILRDSNSIKGGLFVSIRSKNCSLLLRILLLN